MDQLYNRVSYIVCYREASIERRNALCFTIRRFREYFPSIEILVVEQDSESKLEMDKDLGVRHLFILNEGLFNRSWAFNCAIKNTTKDIFVFVDADIFLEKDGYVQCFEAALEFDAITPNKVEISNVVINEHSSKEVSILDMRKLYTFAGGMLLMTRSGFNKIGGWDERFVGWGREDNAMSHVIFNHLKSVSFNLPCYHIDHSRRSVDSDSHSNFIDNDNLWNEIRTRNGLSLKRYIQQLKASDLGNPEKYSPSHIVNDEVKLQFVLAITTYNRLSYLKDCIESFLRTRNDNIIWQLIIADDNSSDGTAEYLLKLEKEHNAIILRNNRTNIHHQVNTILKTLSGMTYDLCFKCDDDIIFIQSGWEEKYWNTIDRTGYDHLIYYDLSWQPHRNLPKPIGFGTLVSNCRPDQVQGAFYTLTNRLIDAVGYLDVQQFGGSGLGHVDFSFRCCRAGFNVLANPFDVDGSNAFIQLQSIESYSSAHSLKEKSVANSKKIIARKRKLLRMDRLYIPYNEHLQRVEDEETESIVDITSLHTDQDDIPKYKKADATFYPNRGMGGFVGFLLKRFYNLSIELKLYFIPRCIKYLGRVLNKISLDFLNIDQ